MVVLTGEGGRAGPQPAWGAAMAATQHLCPPSSALSVGQPRPQGWKSCGMEGSPLGKRDLRGGRAWSQAGGAKAAATRRAVASDSPHQGVRTPRLVPLP